MFTGECYSEALRLTTRVNVILPEPGCDATPVCTGTPKTLYLLHGLGADAGEWARLSKIEYYAKKYNFIVVMPEVHRSFYTDAVSGPRYFTYVCEELPALCEKWLRLPAGRENTFVAGESMGGYGAVKCALRVPERFGAAATLSGALDLPALMRRVQSGAWPEMLPQEAQALFGPDGSVPAADDVIALVRMAAKDPDRPRLIQLCGTEDFLYEDNRAFRTAAEQAGYGHTYMEWPGEHAWPFWDAAIQRALQFFCGLSLTETPLY